MGRNLFTHNPPGGATTGSRKHKAQSLGRIKNRTLAMTFTGLIGQRLGGAWEAAGGIILTLLGFRVLSAYQFWL